MDCPKVAINSWAEEEYALYLALHQLMSPSSIIAQHPMTLADFELLHPQQSHLLLQLQTRAVMLESGLEPIPFLDNGWLYYFVISDRAPGDLATQRCCYLARASKSYPAIKCKG
jgi:hypothetical protein